MRASNAGLPSALAWTRCSELENDSTAFTNPAYCLRVIKCGRRTGDTGFPPATKLCAFMRSWRSCAQERFL